MVHSSLRKLMSSKIIKQMLFIGRNKVVAKVMFLLVSVILSTGGVCPRREAPPGRRSPPGRRYPPEGDPPERDPLKEGGTPRKETPRKETSPGRRPPRKEAPPARRHPSGRRHPPQGDPPNEFKFTFTEVKVMVGVINPLQNATYLRYQRTSVLCCPSGLPLWWCRPGSLEAATRPWSETPCGRLSRGTAGTPGTSDARTSAGSRSERPTPRSPGTRRKKNGLMVCFHCPIPIPMPILIPIPMKLGSMIMCRSVSTEPTPIPIVIPIPNPMATVPNLAPISVLIR